MKAEIFTYSLRRQISGVKWRLKVASARWNRRDFAGEVSVDPDTNYHIIQDDRITVST